MSLLSKFDASKFRCKQYEPVFKSIYNSYITNKGDTWDILGGGGSGKTIFISSAIIFFLPEVKGERALVIIDDTTQKDKMITLFTHSLMTNGYNFSMKTSGDKTETIEYGNNNQIIIMTTKTGSKLGVEEKFKGPIVPDKSIRFIWFEEFTATYMTIGNLKVYLSIMARLKRLSVEGHSIFHTYNPPNNIGEPINEWSKTMKYNKLVTTIYKQPKKWQDKETLELFEVMKQENPNEWQNLALGLIVGTKGLAYPLTDQCITEEFRERYIDYYVFIDNGTDHATCFELWGLSQYGTIELLDTYYHSGRNQGYKNSIEYLDDFVEWASNLPITNNTLIACDSKDFALILDHRGYNAKYIATLIKKNMGDFLRLGRLAMAQGKIKIVNTPNNFIVIQQLRNLRTTQKLYNGVPTTIPHKTEGNNVAEQYTMHGVDPMHYMLMVLQYELMLYE